MLCDSSRLTWGRGIIQQAPEDLARKPTGLLDCLGMCWGSGGVSDENGRLRSKSLGVELKGVRAFGTRQRGGVGGSSMVLLVWGGKDRRP